ncbi:MAG: dynamin family protein [Gammaproteobacteria bacterium]|nr:dynamin family protein [Gammaproteobacteria bacterium]
MFHPRKAIEKRLKNLEKHLVEENPLLIEAVKSFRDLDNIAYRLGLISQDESYAEQIPWWPLISILGTFSAGKSTFINSFLGTKLQTSGNQAVDDKFTVICYTNDNTSRVLPGLALDADPRFPFFNISDDIEKVAPGEGERVNAYLQLKTSPTQPIKGKILIDSPGFDADAQRNSTLRITDHIIDLSDLVLVFFDARHPEPGAMKDTLEHLVSKTIQRTDSTKFLYILNQIDTAAKEDNPEEVVGAWQRALSQSGLTAGKFYMIYDEDSAISINDEQLQGRFKSKKDADLQAIYDRMHQVETERAYRIIGALDKTASAIENKVIPELKAAIRKWTKRVLIMDAVIYGVLLSIATYFITSQNAWENVTPSALIDSYSSNPLTGLFLLILFFIVFFGVHIFSRRFWSSRISNLLPRSDMPGNLVTAFEKNTRFWRSVFNTSPYGWNRRVSRKLREVSDNSGLFVQKLNDNFANPSGRSVKDNPEATEEAQVSQNSSAEIKVESTTL